ncbi:CBS domain-containing protein [Desulfomicrobium macestii]|uniref:CBS domain-containing protein n=1 Tax=Desulfomicrobium macestii TaxID=90731 RepID=A0ABR9GY77_9BACT|nr:CBS domain-containing protein [Desulfomicrobium macestii]MBE1423408.1 CBS domain-containing protein [Desulfomicrobium macestii]
MEPMTVKELMIPAEHFPRISQEETFGAALRALEQCRIDFQSGKKSTCILLVHDGKGHIVGKVSPMDLLMALEPRYSRLKVNVGEYSRSHSYDKMIGSALDQAALWTTPLHELCTDASGILIRNFVSSPSAGQTVMVTDSLDKALHRFVMNRHDSLFVTDGGRLVGMLAFSDVYAHLSATMKDACAISPIMKKDLHGVP